MLDQNSLLFLAVGLLGLGVMVFGFKFTLTARKIIETIGVVLFHVGVFGIIFLKAPLNLFVSLVALVVSLFILIDPLKLGEHLHGKIYRLFGFIALFVSVIFSLEYFTGFPVWLWIIPIVLYLLPYVIPPIKKIAWFISLVTWLLIFSYVGISGYVLYSHFHPETDPSLISKIFPQLKLKSDLSDKSDKSDRSDKQVQNLQQRPIPQPEPQPVFQQTPPLIPITQPEPPVQSVIPPDPQQILQKNYDELQRKYDELLKENEALKK